MRRREFMAVLGGMVAAWPLAVRAQKSLPRIGWLVFGDAKKLGPVDQSLKDALAQAGLLDGRNVEIVFRYANGMPDRLAELATELVAQRPTFCSLLAVMLSSHCLRQVKVAYPSSVALAIAPSGRELPCLLLDQVRTSPGSRFLRMKWRRSG